MSNESLPAFSELDYLHWTKHPCTEALFAALNKVKDKAMQDVTSESQLFSPNCIVVQAELWGFIRMCEMVLKSSYHGLLKEVPVNE